MKAQFFSFDAIIAVGIIIVVIALIAFVLYEFHPEFGRTEELEKTQIREKAENAIDTLVTHTGNPENWTNT